MIRPRLGSAVLAVVLFLCNSSLAQTIPSTAFERLAVLPVIVGDDAPQLGMVFQAVHDASQYFPDVRPATINEYYTADGQELALRASACGSDATCLAQVLQRFGAPAALVVVLNLRLTRPVARVLLVSVVDQRVAADTVSEVPDRAALKSELTSLTREVLLRAGHAEHGRVEVEAEPNSARIFVEGTGAAGVGRAELTLLPGKHGISAELDGYVSESSRVQIAGSETKRLSMRLEPSAPGLLASPWFWLAVSVVVVGGAVATTAALWPESGVCFVSNPAPRDPCAR